MRTGGVPGAGDPHRRTGEGARLTLDLDAMAENPGEVVTGLGKSLANTLSDTAELGAKALGGAALVAPSWASVKMAEAVGLDEWAARNRAVHEDVAKAVWGFDVPNFDYDTEAEEGGALLGIVGTTVAGGAGLLRSGARSAGAATDEAAGAFRPSMPSPDSTPWAPSARMRPGIDAHIRERDLSVPRNRGVSGAHNADEFEQALAAEGALVVSRTPHPNVAGVERVDYRIARLDHAGQPDGGFKAEVFSKSIYDPAVIPDETMMRWGHEAANDAIRANGGVLPREWTGDTSGGVTLRGYANTATNEVTSFFVEIKP